ncbi:MAG: DUF2946 domain-containing protein [Pseudolabrys sp.]
MNRQLGGRLALFALALQLILSFGHIHAGDLGLAGPAKANTSYALRPANHDGTPQDHGGTHDLCAICVTLSLSATALLPVVASLSLPVTYELEWPAVIQPAQVVFDLKSYYQARAPPRT